MRKKLETIEKSDSVQEAAKKMADKNVSSLIAVGQDGKPKGLVTERDASSIGSLYPPLQKI